MHDDEVVVRLRIDEVIQREIDNPLRRLQRHDLRTRHRQPAKGHVQRGGEDLAYNFSLNNNT